MLLETKYQRKGWHLLVNIVYQQQRYELREKT